MAVIDWRLEPLEEILPAGKLQSLRDYYPDRVLNTLGDIEGMTEAQLLRPKACGRKTLNAIKEAISFGRHQASEPWTPLGTRTEANPAASTGFPERLWGVAQACLAPSDDHARAEAVASAILAERERCAAFHDRRAEQLENDLDGAGITLTKRLKSSIRIHRMSAAFLRSGDHWQ